MVARPGRRWPVVHVTQGTIRPDPSELLLPTMEALADEDVLVVATTGGCDPTELGPLPAERERRRRSSRTSCCSQRASAFVTNGGFIGTNLALHHGVPVIQVGRTEEKAEIGARIEHAGVGLRFGRRPSARRLRDAVHYVLTDRTVVANVDSLAEQYQLHDAPTEAAALLVELASAPPVLRTSPSAAPCRRSGRRRGPQPSAGMLTASRRCPSPCSCADPLDDRCLVAHDDAGHRPGPRVASSAVAQSMPACGEELVALAIGIGGRFADHQAAERRDVDRGALPPDPVEVLAERRQLARDVVERRRSCSACRRAARRCGTSPSHPEPPTITGGPPGRSGAGELMASTVR